MSWDVVLSAFTGTLCAIGLTATIDAIASNARSRRLRGRHATPNRVTPETANRLRQARAEVRVSATMGEGWDKISDLAKRIPVTISERPDMERTRMPVVDLADPDAGAARADEHTRDTAKQPPIDRRPPPTPMPGPLRGETLNANIVGRMKK